ncbi:hypothetical protein HKD37_05G012782 [Glycine soja]
MKREKHASYSSHNSCKSLSEEVRDYYEGRHRSHLRPHSHRREKERKSQEANIDLPYIHGKDNVEANLDWEIRVEQQLKRKSTSKSYGSHSYPKKDQGQGILGVTPSKPKDDMGKTIEKQPLKATKENFRKLFSLSRCHSLLLPPPLLPNKAPTFGHHFCSKSRKEGIFGVVKRISTCGTSKFQLGRIDGDPVLRETRIRATWEYVSSVEEWYLEICRGGQETLGTSGGVLLPKTKLDQSRPNPGIIVMAAQLIHDRVEMECLEGAWETLEGNTRCRFRGMIRFTATSLVHLDEPARTLQRTVEWILPTPTPYRLVEPVQVIEVTSSEEDPEEDLEELPPEPAVDALDFLEGDEDPLPEVDSPEDVMSASEADSTEDSGHGEMAISGGSSS